MLEIVTVDVPELVRTAACAAPLMNTACIPKFSRAGFRVTFVPTPVIAITCGLVGSLSVMVRVAVRGPGPLGVNVTFNVQLPGIEPVKGLTPLLQLLVCVKSEEPERLMLEKFNFVVGLKFRMTTVEAGLGIPTGCVW